MVTESLVESLLDTGLLVKMHMQNGPAVPSRSVDGNTGRLCSYQLWFQHASSQRI